MSKKRCLDFSSTPPPPQKYSKPNVVKPLFDVIYADFLYKLDGSIYLIYGVDDDGFPIIRLQDCSYNSSSETFKNSDQHFFVPRTVRFCRQQWVNLLAAGEVIKRAFEQDETTRLHIGGNIFVTANPERQSFDIREFYLPKEHQNKLDLQPDEFYDKLYPTRRGVKLDYLGFDKVLNKGDDLIRQLDASTSGWPKIECCLTHDGEMDLMHCSICNPNGHSFWKDE